MSRRHLPFCRLDNRTIYLGIHFLLPFDTAPDPTQLFYYCHTDYILSVDLPSQTRMLQKLNLQQQQRRPLSVSTGLAIWARNRVRLVSPPTPSLPLPSRTATQAQAQTQTQARAQAQAQAQAYVQTEGRQTDRQTDACTPTPTPNHPPIPWEARPVKPPRRTQPASPGTAHDSSPGVGTEYGAQVGAVTVCGTCFLLGRAAG